MAIIANNSGMNSDNASYDNGISGHVHDVFLDRQVHNKLLQADEDLDTESYESRLTKPGNNVKSGTNKSHKADNNAEDITGWFPSPKFVARKHEGAKSDNQNAKSNKDSFIHPWKDYRAKKDENFVFKHYHEPKKYIEQYRKEHGCHNSRFASGNQIGEMRRVAFQTSAPSQTQSQNAVQVSLQQIQQGSSNGSGYPSGLHYTNRKEQLGSLQVHQGPTAICSCKTSQLETNNHSHRYKLSQPVRHMSRTNTEVCIQHTSELSDNSSESGDRARSRTPIRRISSATSSRSTGNSRRGAKSPTKITVPANTRTYPLHALTIAWRLQRAWRIQQQLRQQNGKTEVHPQAKPLENLNCVAPEKQPLRIEKKPIEPLGVSLRVQSLHDLLTKSETPLRGYALPKSMPPNPVTNNQGSSAEPTSSDSDTYIESLVRNQTLIQTPDISLDQLSSCALHPNKGSKGDQNSTEILQMFLQDPVLSRLNQRPQFKEILPDTKPLLSIGTPKLFSPDAFLIPQNDVDAMLKVNMWNPIISRTPVGFKKEVIGSGAQPYRTVMTQVPFKNLYHQGQEVKPVKVQQMEGISTATVPERHDYFNPVKNVKLSITRVNNGVSFCRTQFQDNQTSGRKGVLSRGTTSGSLHTKSANVNRRTSKDNHLEVMEPSNNSKVKLPVNTKKEHYGLTANKQMATMTEQRLNTPLPKVKIFENVPYTSFIPSPALSKSASDMYIMDGRAKTSNEFFRPVFGSAMITGRSSIQDNVMKGSNTSAIIKTVMPGLAKSTHKEKSGLELSGTVNNDKHTVDDKFDDKAQLTNVVNGTKDKSNQNTMSETAHQEVDRLNSIVKMFQSNRNVFDDTLMTKVIADKEDDKTKKDSKIEKNSTTIASSKGSKVMKKPAVASGTLIRQDPQLDGLTWAEKLEILRAVNKRPTKPKPRKPKLKYVSQDHDDKIWSPEEEQIYEQRRIKHLMEQARIVKSGKQYDWVHEAQMRARGIDWGTGKLRIQTADSPQINSDCTECHGEHEKRFSKYGIAGLTKESSSYLFDMQNVQRS